jgi:hypothetical protein
MFTAIHYGTSPPFKSYNLKPSTLLSHFSPGRRFCPSETGQCIEVTMQTSAVVSQANSGLKESLGLTVS